MNIIVTKIQYVQDDSLIQNFDGTLINRKGGWL
jgi:hypothetical protein